MILDASLIIISVITLCLYNVWIKKATHKLIFLFWVNFFTYIAFIGIYFFNEFFLLHHADPFFELADLTYHNWPLYLIIGFSFLFSMITLEHLFDNYDLSLVYPMSQISILTASAGYIALGDPFKWSLVIGIFILFVGTFITSLSLNKNIRLDNFFEQLSKVSGPLWVLIFIQVLCHTVSAVVSYLGTKDTAATEYVLHGLRHLHIAPFSFYTAFEFNLGNQPFSLMILAIYLLSKEKYRKNILPCLMSDIKTIIIVTVVYLISMYTYLEAFNMTTKTTILLSLNNLTIPITLVFAYIILKEHISMIKIIGASFIVLGAFVAALF